MVIMGSLHGNIPNVKSGFHENLSTKIDTTTD